MIERLVMDSKYSAAEAAIHLARYSMVKPYCENKVVLDISCGEGYGSKLIKKWGAKKVVGLDISEEAINSAKSNFQEENLEYLLHDAVKLDCFSNNTFDLIVSFETIEHLKKPLEFLKELKRVAKKDAKFIISCPNDYLYYPTDEEANPYHLKKYTFLDFKKEIEKVFDQNKVQYMLGTKADGFMNIFRDINTKCFVQKQMISYGKDVQAIKIFPDIVIDEEKCSYYVAFINISSLEENIITYPNTIERWQPDPISMDQVHILEARVERQYIKENLAKKNSEILEKNRVIEDLEKELEKTKTLLNDSEVLRSQIANSKTYRFSLKLYKIYRKILWWR